MFLTEQGYSYEILDEKDVIPPQARSGVMMPERESRQVEDFGCYGFDFMTFGFMT